jgi:hypothetical protein
MYYTGQHFWPAVEKQPGAQRHKFTKVEDELLKSLVQKYGESNWCAVAAQIKTRTPRQCRERYKNYLSPKIKNGPWTPEEEELLAKKVAEIGPKWAHISTFFAPRSDVNVKNHWTSMVNRRQREMTAIAKKNIAMMINSNQNTEQEKQQIQTFQNGLRNQQQQQQQMPAMSMIPKNLNQNQMVQPNFMQQQQIHTSHHPHVQMQPQFNVQQSYMIPNPPHPQKQNKQTPNYIPMPSVVNPSETNPKKDSLSGTPNTSSSEDHSTTWFDQDLPDFSQMESHYDHFGDDDGFFSWN